MKTGHDPVNHPGHYLAGEGDEAVEVIDVIEAYGLGYHLGNAVKYILRAGKKPGADEIEDLRKAVWYLKRAARQAKRLGPDAVFVIREPACERAFKGTASDLFIAFSLHLYPHGALQEICCMTQVRQPTRSALENAFLRSAYDLDEEIYRLKHKVKHV